MEIIEKNHYSQNKDPKRHIDPIDLGSPQPSALSLPRCSHALGATKTDPQPSNLGPDNFEQVCKELMSEGHGVKFRAPGDSMYPTICDGDLITVWPIKPSKVAVGDIILYCHVNGVTAHRVVDIKAPQSSDLSPQHLFTLRGDAAINDDSPVGTDQILGKVVLLERNGRRIDPYKLRIKLLYKARRLASRLKRRLFFPGK